MAWFGNGNSRNLQENGEERIFIGGAWLMFGDVRRGQAARGMDRLTKETTKEKDND